MAGAEGFEPPGWLDQNQLPYHLATPHHSFYNKISSPTVKGGVNVLEEEGKTTSLMFFGAGGECIRLGINLQA